MGVETTDSPPAQNNLVTGLGQTGNLRTLTAAFKQGFVFELIDSEQNEPLAVHVMVVNPTAYTLSEPFAVSLTPNMAGRVVEESVGHVIREVTLRGTYGRSPKTVTGYEGAQVNSQTASGSVHFAALRGLFRRYSTLKKSELMSSRVRMVLHVLRDDDHFLVSPRAFDTPLDEKARLHYPYNIKLAVLGDDVGSGVRKSAAFTNPIRDIAEAFHDARGFFADVAASIDTAKGKISNIEAVMREVAGAINAVGNVVSGATDTIAYPFASFVRGIEAIADASDQLANSQDDVAYGSAQEMARSLRKLEQAMDKISVYGDRFAERGQRRFDTVMRVFHGEAGSTGADVEQARNSPRNSAGNPAANGGATIGTRTRATLGGDRRGGGLRIPDDSRFAEVVLQSGDTLERIADEYNTDPAIIALINDLRAPYIVRGGGPGFANIGDRLLVPLPGGTGGEGRGTITASTPEEMLYGTDFLLKLDGRGRNLRFDLGMSSSRRDFGLVRGINNVVQGITIAVSTERGATQFVPSVGIRRNVGRKGTLAELLLANVLLRDAILSDSRIERIAKSRVTLDGDILSQEITPVIRGGGTSQALSLPVGSLSGD